MDIHAHRTDSALFQCPICVCFLLHQKRRRLGPVIKLYPKPPQFFYECRLECRTPDADRITILIIVRKHQLCLVIPELRTFKLIIRIAHLAAE